MTRQAGGYRQHLMTCVLAQHATRRMTSYSATGTTRSALGGAGCRPGWSVPVAMNAGCGQLQVLPFQCVIKVLA